MHCTCILMVDLGNCWGFCLLFMIMIYSCVHCEEPCETFRQSDRYNLLNSMLIQVSLEGNLWQTLIRKKTFNLLRTIVQSDVLTSCCLLVWFLRSVTDIFQHFVNILEDISKFRNWHGKLRNCKNTLNSGICWGRHGRFVPCLNEFRHVRQGIVLQFVQARVHRLFGTMPLPKAVLNSY